MIRPLDRSTPTGLFVRLLRLGLVPLFLFAAADLAATGSDELIEPEKEYRSFTLENGLEVVVVENPLAPIATVELAVRNGSFTEGPEYAGLSHLYEHMFFKGNETYPLSQRFLNYLSEIGAIWNATTREEVVYYYFTLPSLNLEAGMELMANTIQTPLFDSLELARERLVVIGEFDRHEASPTFEFSRALDSLTWGNFFTRKEPIGQRDVILSATAEQMREIKRHYYIPNNSLLVVAGDVDSATVHAYAEEYFLSWESGPDPFVANPIGRPDPLLEKTFVQVASPLDIVQITHQWHGPSVSLDPVATYAADVFIYILQQDQSRFQQALVESGLCQGASFSYYTQNYVGPISVSITTTPEKAEEALRVLKREIAAFDDPGYVTEEELETAKSILRVLHLYDVEETSEWSHTIGFWWSTTGGLDYFRNYLDNLRKVDEQDIIDFIGTYVTDKNYAMAVASNKANLQRMNLTPEKALW